MKSAFTEAILKCEAASEGCKETQHDTAQLPICAEKRGRQELTRRFTQRSQKASKPEMGKTNKGRRANSDWFRGPLPTHGCSRLWSLAAFRHH